MADDTEIEFPADLLQAQRDYYAADAEVERLVAQLPSSVDVVAGEAAWDEDLRAAVEGARAERGRLVGILYGHEYWETAMDKYARRLELQKLARAQG
ncbi:hypothetical protein Ssi03_74370 [Sphaerisporangium siamense]|nr:hypothetical protein Ssi03_74370 [Sphaerisporangium siamense]